VPQERERLFLVCTRSRAPLQLTLPKRPHVPVNEVLDWNAPKWTPIEKPGRSVNTLRRVASGRARFGDRFVAPFYSSGSGLTGRSIHRPLGTITTRDRWMVVDGNRMRMLSVPETKAVMGFRADYLLPKAKHEAKYLLGNAVCPPVPTDLLTAIKAAA
jgi:DNA (cytosine-5)-methyltransferase 1